MSEKIEQIKAVFQKHGGLVEQNAMYKGTKYENEIRIIQQPTGLNTGFSGYLSIIENRTNQTNDEKQVFHISAVGTWLGLSGAKEYQRQLSIAISLFEDLCKIDPALVGQGTDMFHKRLDENKAIKQEGQ